MKKYSLEFKLEIIKEYLDYGISYESLSKKYNVGKTSVFRWVKYFNEYGVEGLTCQSNKSYSSEFKIKVLEYMTENRLSYLQTGIHFNIHESVIRKWKNRLGNQDFKGILDMKGWETMKKNTNKNKENLDTRSKKDLLQENERLRAENEYLKKLEALIQKKRLQTKKK